MILKLGINISIGDVINFDGSRRVIEDKGREGILTSCGIEIDYGSYIQGWKKGNENLRGMNLPTT